MVMENQFRLISLLTVAIWRRIRKALHSITSFVWEYSLGFIANSPDHLLMAPRDLRTTDPTIAQEIYTGQFTFAGKTIYAGSHSPFNHHKINYYWERELHQFRWLCHLRAARNELSVFNAKALVEEWIVTCGQKTTGTPWLPEIVAARLIAWISNSPTILDTANHHFYKKFLKSIRHHIRFLRNHMVATPHELPRLQIHIALAYAALCVYGMDHWQRSIHRALGRELDRQILPDGGHLSRNPSLIPEILIDLLPLRQVYLKQGITILPSLMSAIDRLIPAIRFFRHGDGNLALFNGTSNTKQDMIATILRYDDALGSPPDNMVHSGYQRIVADDGLTIMDTGISPESLLSEYAHAGFLSLEFSHGKDQILVNCGLPQYPTAEIRSLARSTAAHSTATIHDTSSSRIQKKGLLFRFLGAAIISGPSQITCKRTTNNYETTINAEHNGYVAPFGLYHARSITLSREGKVLSGRDSFRAKNTNSMPNHSVAIRFHLHPDIRITQQNDHENQDIILTTRSGTCWIFSCDQVSPVTEQSIFFATAAAPCHTTQIVLFFQSRDINSISWRFSHNYG